jgi:hypothetical protein
VKLSVSAALNRRSAKLTRTTAPAAGVAGLVFVALWIVAALVAVPPRAGSAATAVADYFDDEHVSVVTASYLRGAALAFFLVFLGGVAAAVGSAGRW